ncbi:rhomboid family intramembrane serine protease [Bosea sp. BIWAKO-01]|uniref:rhomboid family intramembrane serine protease n=1 Tax=Bosea sp. BIWAKO-01 TaxID=506668 RepID=UPI000853C4B5|nr:rhomboid family intramembrane serine protease [Bosea sp. BIWAKO-01]GAU86469.1 hypothetical protein BIWAKO_06417 [Bosea sp. BIWAKO-01]
MGDAPDWVKGGVLRRGLAFLIDLVVVMIVTQALAAVLFPLSNGALIDGSSFMTDCRPAQGRPATIESPVGFRPTAESICTKSLLGQPTARFYTLSRQEAGSSVTTSLSYALNAGDQMTLAFDLSVLQWPLLALMRWLLEIRGVPSLGRHLLSLRVLPRWDEPATAAEIRAALGRRYILFALPGLASLAMAVLLFAALRFGGPLPNDLESILGSLGNLPHAMAVIAALYAIARGRDAFYDEAAGTTVLRLVNGAREVAPEQPPGAEPGIPGGAPGQAALSAGLRPVPWATLALAALLILVFIGELVETYVRSQSLGVTGMTIVLFGGVSSELAIQAGQWYRLALAMFLHWSLAHLIGNVVILAIAGWFLQPVLGMGWLLAIFLLGGLAGALGSILLNPATLIGAGASGAIMAVIAAGLVVSLRLADDARRLWLQAFCVAILLATFLAGGRLAAGQLDHASHGGGALTGAILGALILLSWDAGTRRPRWARPALAVALGLTALPFLSIPRAGFGDVALARMTIPPARLPKDDAEWFARAVELVRQYPRDPRSHLAHAVAVGNDKLVRERALTLVSRTQAALSPGDLPKVEQNAFLVVGEARRKARDWDAARDLYTRAIATAAAPVPGIFGLRAQAELALGLLDAALEDAEAQVRLQPSSAEALVGMAGILDAMGRQRDAIARFDQALALDPDNVNALRYRGWLAFFDGRPDEAIQGLERALTLKPDDAYAALWLHIVSARSGRGGRLATAAKGVDMTVWPAPIIQFYRGEIDRNVLRAATQSRDPVTHGDQTCEANFYLGEWHLLENAKAEADPFIFYAATSCPKTFVEWAAARTEHRLIER